MKIVSRAGRAAKAASVFKQAQYRNGSWPYGEDKRIIWEKLVALGENPRYEDVDATIGNTSWTRLQCDECELSVPYAVVLGEEPDYDSNTATICHVCIQEADRKMLETFK